MEEQGKLGDPAQERLQEGEGNNYTTIHQRILNMLYKDNR
jgi:hypothetical protein